MNDDIHKHISEYIDNQRRDYITDDFAYASYNAPHTMYAISNDLDDILLKLKPRAYKVWHRTMTLVKRNHDPVMACSVHMRYEYYTDLVSRSSYFLAIKELVDAELLLKTKSPVIKIVNVKYANKLFKPKLEI